MEFVVCTLESDCDDASLQGLHEGQYQIVFFSREALLCSDTWRDMLQTSVCISTKCGGTCY